MSALKPGDRVVITARSHPWYGRQGVIRSPYQLIVSGAGYLIILDDGHECAAALGDVSSPGLDPQPGLLF